MSFYVVSDNHLLNLAALKAQDLLWIGSKMMDEVIKKNDFKYDSGSGLTVATLLAQPRKSIEVKEWRPLNPWTRAIGYYDGNAIYVNKRKLPRLELADLVGLLLHEWAHHCGFHHGNNFKTEDKCKSSVPYWLSSNASRWL